MSQLVNQYVIVIENLYSIQIFLFFTQRSPVTGPLLDATLYLVIISP